MIMERLQVPKDFCKQLLDLDKTIRFAGVARLGNMLMAEYRERLDPLLSSRETEMYTIQTAIAADTRKTMEDKLGKTVYSVTLYEKIKRGTIPLNNDYLLMLSFDTDTDHESIILNKILPLIKKYDLHEE